MKKKLLPILAAVIAFTFVMTGCSKFPSVKVDGVPDSDYAVMGNGGAAVQQGEYLYFVNGYEDYTDADGKSNLWDNSVVKGGIYRAKFVDGTVKTSSPKMDLNSATQFFDPYQGYYGDYKTYLSTEGNLDETVSGLEMKTFKDYDDKDISIVDSVPVVHKKISNAGFADGGLYIFDGYIYYTSPTYEKDKSGNVQYELVDFYRTRLNGQNTQLLYRTTSSETKPKFGYYSYGGKIYLVILDATKLVSIGMTDKKVSKPSTISDKVTGAVFSNKPVYTKNMPTDTAEDFVYFTRAAEDGDAEPNGNVLERIRPDGNGDSRLVIFNNGRTITLDSVKNGYVYYQSADTLGTSLYANSMSGIPLTEDGEVADMGIEGEVTVILSVGDLKEIYVGNQIAAYDTQSKKISVTHYAIASRGTSTVSLVAPSTTEKTILAEKSAKVCAVNGNDFYFVESGEEADTNTVFKANLFTQNQTPISVSKEPVQTKNWIACDVQNGYLFFVSSKINIYNREDKENKTYKTTSNYMVVRPDNDIVDQRQYDMGHLKDADIPEEEEEDK